MSTINTKEKKAASINQQYLPKMTNDNKSEIRKQLAPLKKVERGQATITASSTKEEIQVAQRLINQANSPSSDKTGWKHPRIPETGVLKELTISAINNIQQRHFLTETGTIDRKTLMAVMLDLQSHQQVRRSSKNEPNDSNKAGLLATSAKVRQNINLYCPLIEKALKERGLSDPRFLKYTVATIAAECASFAPQSERASYLSTADRKKDGSYDFSAYEGRESLGNTEVGDGQRFRGRGFVQITGRYNYDKYGKIVGRDLIANPEQANYPSVATKILVEFIYQNRTRILNALDRNDLQAARRVVNGGHNGMDNFLSAWNKLN